MAKTFELNFNKGSVVERYNGYTPSTACPLIQAEKGLAIDSLTNNRAAIYASGGKVPFGTGSWTINFWAKNNSANATKWYFGQGGSGQTGVMIYSSGTYIAAQVKGATAGDVVISNASGFQIGKWLHVTVTCDRVANLLTMYINGVASTPVSISSVVGTLTNSVIDTAFMSYSSANNDAMTGRMSYFACHDKALTQAEINAEYAEFLAAQPINKSKRGFIQNKPTDLSSQVNNTLGANLVANGNFDTDSVWTKTVGWTIDEGKATFTGATTNYISQPLTVVSGKRYRFIFNLIDDVGANAKVLLTNEVGAVLLSTMTSYVSRGTGYYVIEGTALVSATSIRIYGTTGDAYSIDNVMLQELTGLIAAYNMQKVGNTLVDISGNGVTGTLVGGPVQNNEGIYFPRKTSNWAYCNFTSVAGVRTVAMRIKLKDNSFQYFLEMGAGNDRINYNGFGTVYVGGKFDTSYINGVLGTVMPIGSWCTLIVTANTAIQTSGGNINLINGNASGNFELSDFRLYNRVLTLQEIKDYHNQFVQPTLIEDFSDAGADTITKSDAPREWERVSGTWKISENTIQTSPIYTSNFATDDSWVGLLGLSVAGGVTIGSLSNCLECTITGGSSFHVAQRTVPTVLGNRYTVTGKIYFPASGNANGFQFTSSDGITVYSVFTPIAKDSWYDFTVTYTAVGSSPNTIRIVPLVNGSSPFSNDGQKYYLRDINIVQAPQLDTMTNGTKYLECVSAGVLAIPSNIAYGTWEFDWYKGGDTNLLDVLFTNNVPNTYAVSTNGYMFRIYNSERIVFARSVGGSLSVTVNSYIANNVWYRAKVTRTNDGNFTLFLKGNNLAPTAGYDGWTLVSTTGGSGTNPITDNTYTTSNYFVVDLDAGDRIANIIIRDGIKV